MLPFPNMMDLLPHKFSSLSSGRFALPRILAGTFNGFLLRHGNSFSNFAVSVIPLGAVICSTTEVLTFILDFFLCGARKHTNLPRWVYI
jgi:hypothetical protein